MAQKRFITSALVMTGATALAISLTACGSNPINDLADKANDAVAEKGTEKIVEGLSGGKMDIEFKSLPAGFPADIPLASNNVVLGTKIAGDEGEGDGFVVSVAVDADPATVAAQVKADFADWEELSSWNDTVQTGGFTNADWGVFIGVLPGDSDADSIVGYTIVSQTE